MHPAAVFLYRFLFPSICVSCAGDIHPARAEPLCARCSFGMKRAPILIAPTPLERFHAAHLFDGAARDLVLRLKYGRKAYLARYMAGQIGESAAVLREGATVIVPVPLPPFRRLFRGFNPAERLARALAADWGISINVSTLRRRSGFPSQTELGRRERKLNARKSFALGMGSNGIRGKNVLLIDDVSTTGATLSACGQLLLSAGASSVRGAVFAWEPPGRRGETDSVSGGS